MLFRLKLHFLVVEISPPVISASGLRCADWGDVECDGSRDIPTFPRLPTFE